MERLPVAGVQAVGGGVAGLKQDWWIDPYFDPSLVDWGVPDVGIGADRCGNWRFCP